MGLDLRLQHKMSQQLVMTPQLQQAIKLLQLSHQEMGDMLRQELEQNPVLEESQEHEAPGEVEAPIDLEMGSRELDPHALGPAAGEEAAAPPPEAAGGEAPAGAEEPPAGASAEPSDAALEADMDWESYGDAYEYAVPPGASGDADLPGIEATASGTPSLRDHLAWQAQMADFSAAERALALVLIDMVDEDGYLPADCVPQQAEAAGLEEAEVEAVLQVVQGFEPVGVAARSLGECLRLQVDHLGLEPLVRTVVTEHLALVERRQWQAIARACGVTAEDVAAAVRALARLEPRPGRAFSDRPAQYVTPDLFVRRVGDDFVISLNEEGLPRLCVSTLYRDGAAGGDSSTRAYLQDKMRSATWLLRSLAMRQRTLVKVMGSILRAQRGFFERGVAGLKPLVLRDIAEDVNMHESTISRVTSHKYVETPQGLFELKYFFTSAIASAAGEVHSSASVRDSIGRLVAEEDPKAPLSDQQIVALLRAQNVDIARRTVAKYREMLKIRPSSQRRRDF